MYDQFNMYCDESCHLPNDNCSSMALGALFFNKINTSEITQRIKDIRSRYGLKKDTELKWNSISRVRLPIYIDLVDYFFDNDDMSFRGLVIPDKTILDHTAYNQTHDDWYYKMFYDLIKVVLDPGSQYSIYIDWKDRYSYPKSQKLLEVIRNHIGDRNKNIIKKIQPVRSHEIQAMQIVDVLTGALAYYYRMKQNPDLINSGKIKTIERIQERSMNTDFQTTLLREKKFNLLIWEPEGKF